VKVVVDTSVLIDHLRGVGAARDALVGVERSGGRLVGSVLTRTEILAGVRDNERAAVQELFSAIDWIAVDDVIADTAGRMAGQYLRSHPGVDTVDYVLAATAHELGADLLTLNVRHFPMFPDLRAPY